MRHTESKCSTHTNHSPSCHSDNTNEQPIHIGKKLKITLIIFIATLLVSFLPNFLQYISPEGLVATQKWNGVVNILQEINFAIISYLKVIWWAIVLGFLIGGALDYFVPTGFITKHLGRGDALSLPKAMLAGFLMSVCSHGILAIAIQLYKKGAGIPAVITFLLASPWANLSITVLLFGFFKSAAFFIIGAALLISIISGYIFVAMQKLGVLETHPLATANNVEYSWDRITNFNLGDSIKGIIRGAINLANMVLWWLLVGLLMAAALAVFIPHGLMATYFGPTFGGLSLTLAVATVIEVCSEGSAPIAFEIYNQIKAIGNPFVFLMAGVVTDYTEIGLLWANIGKRTAILLPLITVPQVLLIGYLFNVLL